MQLDSKKIPNNQIKKQAEDLNRNFSRKDIYLSA